MADIIGRNLDLFLPQGPDSRGWRGLLNETQMLCHGLALNDARMARGASPLSGLWFSGGGLLPDAVVSPIARLVGDCPLARGLFQLGGASGADELVVEHAADRAVMHADPGVWVAALDRLEQRMGALTGDCAALHVHPGNGTVFRWTPRAARRFWRRRRPLLSRLEQNPDAPQGLQ